MTHHGAGLAIIIVNYGSSSLLEANAVPIDVDALGARVIVVDNFSSREEQRRIRALAATHRWELVEPGANLGFGGGMNLGAARAAELGSTIFLLLNPDLTISTDGIRSLSERNRAEPGGVLAPRILRPDGSVWSVGSQVSLADGRIRSVRSRPVDDDGVLWVSGACLMIGSELWDALGGFSEEYFMYWEDVDLSVRAQQLGASVAIVDDAVAIHDEGGTHRSGPSEANLEAKSRLYYFYNIRNRYLFAALNLDATRRRTWRDHDLAVAREVLLQGGRRQFFERGGTAAISTAISALRDGRRMLSAHRSGSARVQLYEVVRSAHLERTAGSSASTILYERTRYDFDPSLSGSDRLQRAGILAAARYALTHRIGTLEVNEPLQLSAMPRTAAVLIALGIGRRLGRPRTTVVTYAIENAPLSAHPRPRRVRARLKRRMERAAAGMVWRRLDRIAFGSAQSMALYATTFPPDEKFSGARVGRLIEALPAATVPGTTTDPTLTVFLGQLSARKGFDGVLEAWPYVVARVPGARLLIIGKGELETDAVRAAEHDPSVSVRIDPPRSTIVELLQAARILVLPSQPLNGWREQIGLPIVEALAAGCEIVTTDQTGLAPWLAAHGHRVLPVPTTASDIAEALVGVLEAHDRSSEVLASLPVIDGRIAAEIWLNESWRP